MCCFSGPVHVANTSIFARLTESGQILVYEMTFSASSDVAMVLPLPFVPSGDEDALRFIDLSALSTFFAALHNVFEEKTLSAPDEISGTGPALEVHSVGAFEASYVPSVSQFSRLDRRFRLPDRIWSAVPAYGDWGFAVFKLKAGKTQQVHPMAFEFPTRFRDRLFFPTLHVHNRKVEETAAIDHALYCQGLPEPASGRTHTRTAWAPSEGHLAEELYAGFPGMQEQVAEVVDLEAYGFKRTLEGELENRDTWVTLDSGETSHRMG